MVRVHHPTATASVGSPHPRGDGPQLRQRCRPRGSFSPPAWGWSVSSTLPVWWNMVLPTRVGMVRLRGRWVGSPYGSPHPRGDGPDGNSTLIAAGQFSPPAWGWSAPLVIWRAWRAVLPTRVGMVRLSQRPPLLSPGSPHPRGDGPAAAWWARNERLFSPPAWGWSARLVERQSYGRVLPTRVGMVREQQT